MKNLLLTLIFLFPLLTFAQQTCVVVDSVYSTCKAKDLGRRDIRFGIKQIVEDEMSNKYCLSDSGDPVKVEIYYFGTPKTSLRVLGVEKTEQLTQVGVRVYYKEQKQLRILKHSKCYAKVTQLYFFHRNHLILLAFL